MSKINGARLLALFFILPACGGGGSGGGGNAAVSAAETVESVARAIESGGYQAVQQTAARGSFETAGALAYPLMDANSESAFNVEIALGGGVTATLHSDAIIVYDGRERGVTVIYPQVLTDGATVAHRATFARGVIEQPAVDEIVNLVEDTALSVVLPPIVGGQGSGEVYFYESQDAARYPGDDAERAPQTYTIGLFGAEAEYSRLGVWVDDVYRFQSSAPYSGDSTAYMSLFGLATPLDDMPAAGRAQYSGFAAGLYFNPSSGAADTSAGRRAYLLGSATLNVDFAGATLDGTVDLGAWDHGSADDYYSNGGDGRDNVIIRLSGGEIKGNLFEGDAAVMTAGDGFLIGLTTRAANNGKFRGGFFGPEAEEATATGYVGGQAPAGDRPTGQPHLNFGFITREEE